ncbi:MAG: hypothetical protein UY50_C0025G0004 [Parcubacteria group bacterium GW2011_GWA2_49_9]|nr:MAG: hypothetical protein UY50_C0025G0004 [Parcubacteria group bacterium GW2011_GWA2_49_9]
MDTYAPKDNIRVKETTTAREFGIAGSEGFVETVNGDALTVTVRVDGEWTGPFPVTVDDVQNRK